MPANFGAPRPFSATSPVHPSYLPALHKSGRIERRLATATVAAIGVGYGLAKYRALKAEEWQQEHHAQQAQLFRSADAATAAPVLIPVTVPVETAAARQKQNEVVENAYGDRSSLAELEAAVAAYEARRKD
ncbi:hypothetical protein GGS26DRAFT_596242 [Hypomontagnella submonticulosa]|nr:hypothetical protein GGS26DRAFT_596242 [Hypomontagnella submonticulosa]